MTKAAPPKPVHLAVAAVNVGLEWPQIGIRSRCVMDADYYHRSTRLCR